MMIQTINNKAWDPCQGATASETCDTTEEVKAGMILTYFQHDVRVQFF